MRVRPGYRQRLRQVERDAEASAHLQAQRRGNNRVRSAGPDPDVGDDRRHRQGRRRGNREGQPDDQETADQPIFLIAQRRGRVGGRRSDFLLNFGEAESAMAETTTNDFERQYPSVNLHGTAGTVESGVSAPSRQTWGKMIGIGVVKDTRGSSQSRRSGPTASRKRSGAW